MRNFTFLCLLAFLSSGARGQSNTTGALAGVVLDTQRMVLPGSAVTLLNRANGQSMATATDAAGRYGFSLVAPGSYEVRFSHEGFKVARLSEVVVNVSAAPNIEAQLEAGEAAQPVACVCSVTSSGSSTGTLVDQKTITEVPLNTRNATQVLSISSGSAADVNNAGNLGRNNQAVNVNGNTAAGSVNVEGTVASSVSPNPDAIAELKIDTSQYDAGFGAQVSSTNLLTRSGGNQIRKAISCRAVIKKRNRKRRRSRADRPTCRIYCPRRTLCRACRQRNFHHSAGLSPNKRQARTLIHHTRTDNVTAIADTESQRAVRARKCANFKRRTTSDVINHPDISRRIRRVNSRPDDAPRIIYAECGSKKTAVRCRLSYRSCSCAAINNGSLCASAVNRTNYHARSIHIISIAERFACRKRKL